jgi:hypothetical protein
MAGDYYGAGDFLGIGGFFKKKVLPTIGTVAGGVARTFLPGLPGRVAGGVITAVTGAGRRPPPVFAPSIPAMGRGYAAAAAAAPAAAAAAGEVVATQRARNVIIDGKRWHYNKYGELKEGRIPVMNPLNPRALARSSRRIDGMRKGMGRALKHTNYKLVSKSAGRGRGSRGVITKAEAARALRR